MRLLDSNPPRSGDESNEEGHCGNRLGAIVDGQIQATQKYAASLGKLTDAEALQYVSALLERDQKVHDLRVKWLAKFQTVVPGTTAARAIQVERRLGLVHQVGVSSQVPLVR